MASRFWMNLEGPVQLQQPRISGPSVAPLLTKGALEIHGVRSFLVCP